MTWQINYYGPYKAHILKDGKEVRADGIRLDMYPNEVPRLYISTVPDIVEFTLEDADVTLEPCHNCKNQTACTIYQSLNDRTLVNILHCQDYEI